MMLQPLTPQHNRRAVGSAIRAEISRFPKLWRESHLQAAKDFRTRWRGCGMWCLFAMWFLALSFSLITLLLIGTGIQHDLGACLPDGSFTIDPDEYRYFSRSGFFEITLAFGSMTFTQVKALDVAWDILVGRGGQSLLAYISWRVFANYVTTSMEVMPVTFRTYRTIFLQNGSLLLGIPRLVRDFRSRHALHSRLAMVFMVFTMAFSLAFPTMVSSLTGYKGKVDAFVKTAQDNYVPFGSLDYVSYIIHDGGRVEGLQDNYIVLANGLRTGRRFYEPTITPGGQIRSTCLQAFGFPSEDCYIVKNVTNYVDEYGTDGVDVASTFMGKELPSPTLNISDFSVKVESFRVFNQNTSIVSKRLRFENIHWAYENNTYNKSEMMQNGKCQPNLDYQWGFSFIQSFITILFLLIWSIGIYIMWLRSHSIMKHRGRTDVAGENKAVLELAHAIQQQHASLIPPIKEQYDQEEKDSVSAIATAVAVPVTEAALHRRITKDLRGGSIAYVAPLLANGEITDVPKLLAWIKSHKWSIAGMVPACIACSCSGIFIRHNVVVMAPLPLELAIALYMGSTRASRTVIFFWAFILFGIVPQIVLSALYTTLN